MMNLENIHRIPIQDVITVIKIIECLPIFNRTSNEKNHFKNTVMLRVFLLRMEIK